MNDRNAARLTGVLFIVATAVNLLGAAIRPNLAGSDYLARMAADPGRVAAGSLLLLIAAFACAGIAVAMYPVLGRAHTGLALGSVVFRTMEAVMLVVAVVSLLSLSTLGQASIAAGAAESASVGVVGGLLVGVREHAALAGVFAFCLGAFLYYVALFQSRLIPRWLSVWGVAAIVMLATAGVLALFADRPITSYVVLAFPIFVQEMVLAAWLIAKGFSPAAAISLEAGTAASREAVRTAPAPAAPEAGVTATRAGGAPAAAR